MASISLLPFEHFRRFISLDNIRLMPPLENQYRWVVWLLPTAERVALPTYLPFNIFNGTYLPGISFTKYLYLLLRMINANDQNLNWGKGMLGMLLVVLLLLLAVLLAVFLLLAVLFFLVLLLLCGRRPKTQGITWVVVLVVSGVVVASGDIVVVRGVVVVERLIALVLIKVEFD